MPASQEKISEELRKRNLTKSKIVQLTHPQEVEDNEKCPRCGSNNFQQIKDNELRATKYGGYEVEVNSQKCRICSYNAHKDQALNWKVWFKQFFRKYSWTKLK
ncbi:hypothetical protein ALE3EI_1599 [Constantimarinum furrinae]|uniref:Uncharacterized protein n=2 Tax=Constantimarinum furrinae TaxID=2562285 RepID=A0A7G8PUZ0_9FLAO|nr:hypothetical protein ALE3EI_1599 [Constantimarinum furrinae]